MTQQPKWQMIDNLGDVNPVEYGGFFVYIDRTGVYPPEIEVLESGDSDADGWTLYRTIIEPTPEDEWWYEKLGEVASSSGIALSDLYQMIKSVSVIEQAMVYRDMIGHFGPHEFDSYPQHFTKRSQLPRRIRRYNSR